MKNGIWVVHTKINNKEYDESVRITTGDGTVFGEGTIERPPKAPVRYTLKGEFLSRRLVQYELWAQDATVVDHVVGMWRLDNDGSSAQAVGVVAGLFAGNDDELPVVAQIRMWWDRPL